MTITLDGFLKKQCTYENTAELLSKVTISKIMELLCNERGRPLKADITRGSIHQYWSEREIKHKTKWIRFHIRYNKESSLGFSGL